MITPMGQKLARLSLPAVLSVGIGACGLSPDSPEAIAALGAAITLHDVDTTHRLLQRGVDPTAQIRNGQSPVQSALEAITGTTRDSSFVSALEDWEAGDPRMQVLREVMRVVRRLSHTPFEGVGGVRVLMMEGEYIPGRGRSFSTSLSLVMETGEQHELAISRWETDYLKIARDGWPILRPGGSYRVVGVVNDDVLEDRSTIEVESIELINPPDGDSQSRAPTVAFLPSTVKQMRALTWIGDP